MAIDFLYPQYEVVRNPARCIACRACERQCSNEVHAYDDELKMMISDESRCVNCHRCVSICPTRALKIVKTDHTFKENANWSGETIMEVYRQASSGGVLLYAVPTARHLYGLKEVLYDEPYENAEQQTEYSGFTLIGERTVTDTITVEGDQIRNLFAMTPYFWKTPHVGALRLAAKQSLTTEIGFRFLAYRRV